MSARECVCVSVRVCMCDCVNAYVSVTCVFVCSSRVPGRGRSGPRRVSRRSSQRWHPPHRDLLGWRRGLLRGLLRLLLGFISGVHCGGYDAVTAIITRIIRVMKAASIALICVITKGPQGVLLVAAHVTEDTGVAVGIGVEGRRVDRLQPLAALGVAHALQLCVCACVCVCFWVCM